MELRLNKFLALAGVSSRRRADRLVAEGRVKVNGVRVRQLGVRVEAGRDVVEVDDHPVQLDSPTFWGALHKPAGYLTTWHDPFRRPDLSGLLAGLPTRAFPVGRLDQDSEGLILVTNDGELAYRLTHPRYQVEKEYRVEVGGEFPPEIQAALRQGVRLSDGPARPRAVDVLRVRRDGALLRLVLTEGRKREIRRMLAAVGVSVRRLVRVRVGGVKLAYLPSGVWRHLREAEIQGLRRMVGLASAPIAGAWGGNGRLRGEEWPPGRVPGRIGEEPWEEF